MNIIKSTYKYLAVFVIIALSACSPTQDKADFDNTIAGYYGMKVDKLVDVWGAPHASYCKEDKTYIYKWVQSGASHHFGGASYPWIGAQSHGYAPWNHALWPAWHGGVFSPGISMFVSRPMTLDRSCSLNIYANSQNVITGHDSEGIGCVSE